MIGTEANSQQPGFEIIPNTGHIEKINLPGGKIRIGLIVQKELVLPIFTGAIVRAAFLNFLKENNPVLGDKLHIGNERRPYSITPIRTVGTQKKNKRGELLLNEGTKIEFELKILKQKLLSETIMALLEKRDSTINILNYELPITEIELIKPEINLKQMTNKIKIFFKTPTYFASKMQSDPVLFPNPSYFYMNVFQIWNYFNRRIGTINEKVLYNWIKENIIVNDYATYTQRVYIGKKTPIKGFRGWVVYKLKNKELIGWIGLLSHYAELSNVGGNRTAGLGLISIKWLE